MPFATNANTKIYYETHGKGPAVVLHHGTFGSGADWADKSYVAALESEFKVVLVDARGHGRSDKPLDPKRYDLSIRAADVAAVLDAENIGGAHFLGFSLGGWIGYGLAKHFPERFRSFTIIGAHPFAEDMQPFRDLMPTDPKAFEALVDRLFGNNFKGNMRSRILANDLEAMRVLTQDRVSNEDILHRLQQPFLLIVGSDDPRRSNVQKCASSLAHSAYVELPNCDHVASTLHKETILAHFLKLVRSS